MTMIHKIICARYSLSHYALSGHAMRDYARLSHFVVGMDMGHV